MADSNPPQSRPGGRFAAAPAPAAPASGWAARVTAELASPKDDYFDGLAKQIADSLGGGGRDNPHQIRRFYDELCQWQEKARAGSGDPAAFARLLPFVRMMNAKVAYGAGRRLVSQEFQSFFTAGLRGVKDRGTLANFKLLFEAVIGFQKAQGNR